MKRDIYAYDSKKGRNVVTGTLFATCFCRTVPAANIMQKIMKGCIGMQDSTIEQLSKEGCRFVAITIPGFENIYISRFSDWETNFTGRANFGHGGQTFLDMNRMKVTPLEGFNPLKAEVLYAHAKP